MSNSENKGKTRKKSKGIAVYNAIIFILLILTLSFMIDDLQKISSGNYTSETMAFVILETMALLILPFLGSTGRRRFAAKNEREDKENEEEDREFSEYLKRRIKMPQKYSPPIISKCPFCGFDNPSNARVCLKCGRKLY